MRHDAPEFAALVCGAFDAELARTGDRARAFGAAVAAVTAAYPGERPAMVVMAVGRALDAALGNRTPGT